MKMEFFLINSNDGNGTVNKFKYDLAGSLISYAPFRKLTFFVLKERNYISKRMNNLNKTYLEEVTKRFVEAVQTYNIDEMFEPNNSMSDSDSTSSNSYEKVLLLNNVYNLQKYINSRNVKDPDGSKSDSSGFIELRPPIWFEELRKVEGKVYSKRPRTVSGIRIAKSDPLSEF